MRRLIALLTILFAAAGSVPLAAAPAHAATADQWGFVHVDNPSSTTWTTFDPGLEWGSWKDAYPTARVLGVKTGPGRMTIRFPHAAGAGGLIHVTSNDYNGNYCQARNWYPLDGDENVLVLCFRPDGTAADTRFSLLWTTSSGPLPPVTLGDYSYLRYSSTGVSWYNTQGTAPEVTKMGIGWYFVRFTGTGLNNQLAGSLQVTAVMATTARRCNIYAMGADGNDVYAHVRCYDSAGYRADSGFTASYHFTRSMVGSYPPENFGYVWDAGVNAPYTNYDNHITLPKVTVTPWATAGIYSVTYPKIGVAEVHSQVTARSTYADYCNVTNLGITSAPGSPPADGTAQIRCFDKTGKLSTASFFTAYTSRT
jgi:hypothetical protein